MNSDVDFGKEMNIMILLRQDNTVVKVQQNKSVPLSNFVEQPVFITDNYDSCTMTLSPIDLNAVEIAR